MKNKYWLAAIVILITTLFWTGSAIAAPQTGGTPPSRLQMAETAVDGTSFTVTVTVHGCAELVVMPPGGSPRTLVLEGSASPRSTQIAAADFEYAFGIYRVAAFSCGPGGKRTLLGVVQAALRPAQRGFIQVTPAGSAGTSCRMQLKNASVPPGTPVWFHVSQPQGGTLIGPIPARRLGSTYEAILPFAGLSAGDYLTSACAGAESAPALLGTGRFVIPGVSPGSLQMAPVPGTPEQFSLCLKLSDPPESCTVHTAVWSQPDQSDLIWYPMDRHGSVWTAEGNFAAHTRRGGQYHAHAWADLPSGVRTLVGTASAEWSPVNRIWTEMNMRQAIVYIQNPAAGDVRAAVWSESGGQDDLVWYESADVGGNLRKITVPLARHTGSGLFVVHVYVGGTCLPASFTASEEAMQNARTMRGLWVPSVLNLDFPTVWGAQAQQQEFREIVRNARDWGFNALFVQVRPHADALYRSEINPWSHVLTGRYDEDPGYDPLAFMTETAHAAGIELHAWLNPYRVCRSSQYQFLSARSVGRLHPDWLLWYDGGVFLDPARPEVREHVAASVKEILANYDVDGIHFDDYFYPYNYPLPDGADPDGPVGNARREHVTALIRDVSRVVRSSAKQVVFGISPFGVWKNDTHDPRGSHTTEAESYYSNGCDTLTWIQEGLIDYVCPQLYWEMDDPATSYRVLADWWAHAVAGTDVELLIGQGVYKPSVAAEIREQLQLNETYPAIGGSIFYRYADIRDNPALAAVLKEWNSRYRA